MKIKKAPVIKGLLELRMVRMNGAWIFCQKVRKAFIYRYFLHFPSNRIIRQFRSIPVYSGKSCEKIVRKILGELNCYCIDSIPL